ncbi:hypothetical protein L3Q82_019566 [Scortum barcoo]|uniref:Uncharacterized protein n=1 Tax=Scortum barcoo TaxID=214431 RepID=A0ACB8VCL4_9TELE|nr:hypothetical protein L3Q82_019566 [Scortum barcoo]
MAAGQTVMFLVVVVLCLPGLIHSFQPLFSLGGKSITHRDITVRAVLRKTAEVCRDIAASEGRDFNLTIDDSLTAVKVQRACSSTSLLSTIKFQTSIANMYFSNAAVDLVFALSKEHHFDDETFQGGRDIITAGVSAVKASVKLENFVAGRLTLGRVCHTLQDFYSHSNWVELGKTTPYSALIRPDQPLENLAGPGIPTCRNCTNGKCDNNLLPDLLQQGLLTSGYFNIFSSAKPAGKCSHGGSFDQTSKQDPVGGISKDDVGSSHGSLHHNAADLAVNATMELLEDIRVAVGDNNFLRYGPSLHGHYRMDVRLMGLSQSSVLCFVIDTTGSMSDDIAEAKRVSFDIIDSKRRTQQEPSAYILVPFNDPGFGPLLVTTDADIFKDSINKLLASGGGDIPELCLSGLQLALTAAPPSSEIFIFTDAPAKDADLKSTVTALIESTKSVVTFMLTDVLASRRRRSPQGVSPHTMSQSDTQLYRDLARASGGQAIEVTKSDLSVATSVIEDSSASAVVTVFQVVRNTGSPGNFTFTVDGSLKNMTAYITGASSLTFSITSSTGVSQTSSQSSGPLATFTTAGNLRRLSLNTDNQTGSWEISVDSSNPYSVKVTGQSSVNFIFNLVEAHEGAHGDFSLKEERPLSGGNASLLVSVTGSDTVKVTEVTLFDSSGPTESVGEGNFLVTFSGVPAGDFVVRLKGEDSGSTSRSSPSSFQRQASTQIKTSSMSVTAQTNSTNIEPGSTISVPFTVAITTNGVVNDSATGTFTVRTNNDRGYSITSPSTITIAAGSGGKANGTITLTAPASAASGTDVTLTIEAENAAAADINYTVLRFSVTAKVTDVTRPVCQVVSTSTSCPSSSSLCASSQWEFIANLTDGINGTGIETVTIRQGNGTLNTSIMVGPEGENITVATYSASCCSQNVELVAVDGDHPGCSLLGLPVPVNYVRSQTGHHGLSGLLLQPDGIPYFRCPPPGSGLPPRQAPETLRPQLRTAAFRQWRQRTWSTRTQCPPASLGICEKLFRRWELKTSLTEGSARRSQQTLTIRLGLPGTNNSKRPIPNPKAQGSDPLIHQAELQHMAAELGSYKQAHTSSPPLTLGNSRVVEVPAPLKKLDSRAQAMRGEFWSKDWVAEAAQATTSDCHPNHIALAPHGPSCNWVVSLLEGGPTSAFWAEPTRDPMGRPPGACLRAPTPGLAPGWGPGCLGSGSDLFRVSCMIVNSDVDAVLDVGHDQSLEALHDYRGEGYRPIVIQACHCGRFGDGDDRGSLQAGGDRRLLERGVEDVHQHLVCDALYAPPHTPWIVGREVSLDPLGVCGLGPLHSCSQLSPSRSECQSVTRPERSIPGFQQRPDLRIQPGFLVRIFCYCPGAGDVLCALADVAEDSRCIVLQVHLSLTDSCLPEDLPVCALETVLQCGDSITGPHGEMEMWSKKPRMSHGNRRRFLERKDGYSKSLVAGRMSHGNRRRFLERKDGYSKSLVAGRMSHGNRRRFLERKDGYSKSLVAGRMSHGNRRRFLERKDGYSKSLVAGRMFDYTSPSQDASRALLSLKQRGWRVIDYAIEFRTLAADSGRNEVSINDAFVNGLVKEIKDHLAPHDLPTYFEDLVDLATCIDTRLQEKSERDDAAEGPPCHREHHGFHVKATSLPPHREWDCAIDLLPGAPLPKTEVMEEYIVITRVRHHPAIFITGWGGFFLRCSHAILGSSVLSLSLSNGFGGLRWRRMWRNMSQCALSVPGVKCRGSSSYYRFHIVLCHTSCWTSSWICLIKRRRGLTKTWIEYAHNSLPTVAIGLSGEVLSEVHIQELGAAHSTVAPLMVREKLTKSCLFLLQQNCIASRFLLPTSPSSFSCSSFIMAAGRTVMFLVFVVFLRPGLIHSFKPLFMSDGSITHRDITVRAVLRKTAEVCRDIAASEGRDFSLTIDDSLTAGMVQKACSTIRTSSSLISYTIFQAFIAEMYLMNAEVDLVYALSAEHHFDEETFPGGRDIITRGVSVVNEIVRQDNFVMGRSILGQTLHTLQDFYSHSNWVELGKTTPYTALITPDQLLTNLAGKIFQSCTGEDCSSNILPEVLTQGLLTSGYFSLNFISPKKPPGKFYSSSAFSLLCKGKCSHGGTLDATSYLDPVGGINKDTADSSHGFIHKKAAKLAVDATIELLENIRLAVGDRRFLRLMGLYNSSALCFVIDTTGSMGDDIAEVKRVSFEIIDSKKGTLQEPSVYILVPFNDPDFGPVISTTDADTFKDSINRLTASGGGDTPEMCLSGLRLALTAAPSASEVFVFTDAPAKDSYLKSTITVLTESTKSKVTFMLTQVFATRRRRSNLRSSSRSLSQSEAQLYRDLAQDSGGQAIEVTKSDLFLATTVVEDSSASALVTVFQVAMNPGRPEKFTFIVDASVSNMIIHITGASSLTFNLTSSTGASQYSNESTGPLASLTTVGNLFRLSLNTTNQTGSWEISVNSNNPYSVKITGQSSVDFIYNLLVAHEGAHSGFSRKDGRVTTGSNVTLLVTVTESEMVTVTEVTLFDSSVPKEISGSLQASGDGNFLATFNGVPAGDFVVRLKGEVNSSTSRSKSSSFQRQGTTRIKTSSISVTCQASTPSGTDVTLTIEVQNAAGTDINYAVLRFSVTAKVTDFSSPVCQVVSITGNCPNSSSLCASSKWEFTANLTDGINGTGIARITISQGNGTLNTSMVAGAGGENITVAVYSGSCCSQNVELVAVDNVGNVGTCVGQARAPEAVTTAPINTTSSGGHTLALSYCLCISVVVSLLWK